MMTPEERAKLAVAFDGYHIRLADVPSIESRVAAQIRDAVEEAARQAQVVMVEQILISIDRLLIGASNDAKNRLAGLGVAIRAVSPKPDYIDRERLKARLDELRLWRDDKAKALRIAELERELAAMEMK